MAAVVNALCLFKHLNFRDKQVLKVCQLKFVNFFVSSLYCIQTIKCKNNLCPWHFLCPLTDDGCPCSKRIKKKNVNKLNF